MLLLIFIISFLSVFYAYFGYPLFLYAANRIRVSRENIPSFQDDSRSPLSIIITVRNEEAVLEEKLEGTLALIYGGKSVLEHLADEESIVQVIVASDASDDETDSIAEFFAEKGVELIRLPERGGKETAQREAIASAKGELLVFTDAKIRLEADVLDRFARYFQDPTVGAVSSNDKVESDDGAESGEGFYVRYEMWLRSLESEDDTLVGLSGSCFAVRAKVCENLATDIPSDFALLLEAVKKGLRGVHGEDVIASYKAVRTEQEEFQRKVRTVLRGITTFFKRSEALDIQKYGTFAWQLISHKLMRWLVPWFSLVAAFSGLFLAASSRAFHWLGLLIIGFFICAALGYVSKEARQQKYFKLPLFFIVTNAAIAVAWIKYLGGARSVRWDPSKR